MSLEKNIESVVKSLDLVLYDVALVHENGETIYRISVQESNKKSVSLDRCVELTHLISPLLDVTPPTSGEYRLEVGTPGLERKLSSLHHFSNSVGELVKIMTSNKEKIEGLLKDVKNEDLYIETDADNKVVAIGDIIKARTYIKW